MTEIRETLINLNPNNCIYYLYDYVPKNTGRYDSKSQLILDYKDEKRPAINQFNYEIMKALFEVSGRNSVLIKHRTICVVPSHEAFKWSNSLQDTADFLSEKIGMRNGYYYLRRYRTIEKLSHGGNRSVEQHKHSIDIKYKKAIPGKHFILLDDVTTTGNSLEACRQILNDNGAKSVRCIAIGRTLSDKPNVKYDKFVQIKLNV